MRSLRLVLVASACFAISACQKQQTGSAATKSGVRETWQAIYIGKTRVGYARSLSEPIPEKPGSEIACERETSMVMSRFGQSVITRSVFRSRETPAGELLEFQQEIHNPPAATKRTRGKVQGDKLLLENEIDGKVTANEQPWDKSVKAPAYEDRMFAELPLRPREERTLKTYEPTLQVISTAKLRAGEWEEVQLLDGSKRRLLRVEVTQSATPGVVLHLYVDEAGETWKTTVGLLDMATYKVTKDEALKEASGAELDLGIATLVKVRPANDLRKSQQAVYRIKISGEVPEKLLATGPTQSIKTISADTIELTVSTITPPKQTPPQATTPGAEFLGANRFLQSDDERVRQHALVAVGDERDSWQASLRMERWVRDNLKQKNFSTLLASASEVARDLSGDCTEHAVLLAAMARSRGIPARLAIGLVYVPVESAFGGHMWTEVWINGVWVPLDATLGAGGIAADHIKFSDATFPDNGPSSLTAFLPLVSVLGKMQIEVMSTK